MKFLRLLSVFFCLAFAKGYADYSQNGCGPCGPQDCGCCPQECCCFELSAEWLYMLSSIDQPFYVQELRPVSGDPYPFGKRYANDQGWHSGYRIEGRYFIPCSCGDYVRARWTNFPCFEDTRRIFLGAGNTEGGAILTVPTDVIQDDNFSARIRHRFEFYNLEVLWGRPVYCCCGLNLDLEFGVQWSRINWHERVTYEAPDEGDFAIVRNKSQFCGFGPEIILDFSYCFCDCLSIKGRSAFAFLVNRRQARFEEHFHDDSMFDFFSDSDNDKYWYGTPAFDLRVGLNYASCLACCGCDDWRFNIEVGYEFIHFIKAVDRIYFVDDLNVSSSFVQHQDFTLHGPYVHLGVCF